MQRVGGGRGTGVSGVRAGCGPRAGALTGGELGAHGGDGAEARSSSGEERRQRVQRRAEASAQRASARNSALAAARASLGSRRRQPGTRCARQPPLASATRAQYCLHHSPPTNSPPLSRRTVHRPSANPVTPAPALLPAMEAQKTNLNVRDALTYAHPHPAPASTRATLTRRDLARTMQLPRPRQDDLRRPDRGCASPPCTWTRKDA